MTLPDLRRLQATITGAHKQALQERITNPGARAFTIAAELATMVDSMERLMQAAESAPVPPQTN